MALYSGINMELRPITESLDGFSREIDYNRNLSNTILNEIDIRGRGGNIEINPEDINFLIELVTKFAKSIWGLIKKLIGILKDAKTKLARFLRKLFNRPYTIEMDKINLKNPVTIVDLYSYMFEKNMLDGLKAYPFFDNFRFKQFTHLTNKDFELSDTENVSQLIFLIKLSMAELFEYDEFRRYRRLYTDPLVGNVNKNYYFDEKRITDYYKDMEKEMNDQLEMVKAGSTKYNEEQIVERLNSIHNNYQLALKYLAKNLQTYMILSKNMPLIFKTVAQKKVDSEFNS